MNAPDTQEKRRRFRARIARKPILSAPGCYDAFSARLIEYTGFEAAYMTGAGVSAGLAAAPDIGLLTMTEMVEQARRITDAVGLPLIADADTGYGGSLNVYRTVRQFEDAGVCAIHIEDQDLPKRCGHLEGKRIVPAEIMVERLRAALDARRDPNFLIIARTDARAVLGFEAALERAQRYGEAGADVLFVEAPEGVEELGAIGRRLSGWPLFINRGGAEKTPHLSVDDLETLGFSIVIFPGDTQKAAGQAMLEVLRVLKQTGNTEALQSKMMGFHERFELLGLSGYRSREAGWAAGGKKE
ncbi:MAG: isocitrate lyase/PEP mutase family protein [Desulfobacterales bacterium]|jgi:2-methylisocitrate lyase-like PEP mutase family enzyme|nr:isocitrate lyase/PEP mutase family protein [Desulfobacterales bacterium]